MSGFLLGGEKPVSNEWVNFVLLDTPDLPRL